MQSKGTASPGIRSRVEQGIYLSVSALLLIGLALSLLGLGHSLKSFGFFGQMGAVTKVGFFVVIVFSGTLLILTLRRSMYARLSIISATSVVVALGLVELGLQVCECGPRVTMPTSDYPLQVLEKLDLIQNARERGVEIFPGSSASLLREAADTVDSDLFLSHIGNSSVLLTVEDDGLITTRTDENGFRNPPGLYDETDSFDVFLLGDSFTEGWSVPDGFTIADRIRQSTNWSVYNGGLNNSGLVHNLAVFIEYGLPKEPAHVLFIMPEELSLGRIQPELKNERLHQYYSEHQDSNLLAKRETKDRILRGLAEAQLVDDRQYALRLLDRSPLESFVVKTRSGSRLVQLLIHYNRGLSGELELFRGVKVKGNRHQGAGVPACNDPEFIPARKASMQEVVSWLDGRVEEYGGTLYIVYLPWARFFGYSGWPECEHDMVIEVTKELGVPLIDVIPVMSKYDDPKKFFANIGRGSTVGGHNNRDGYRLIAEQIVERLGLAAEGQRHEEAGVGK